MTDLTHDAFLGGKVHLWQPRKGYRAGVDPVLLAAAVPARSGDTVMDLGCGAGAAGLCLAARVVGVTVTGVEVQEDYAALARLNAAESGLPLTVLQADLRTLPEPIRHQQFTHVMMNPPYFARKDGTAAKDPGRDLAFGGDTLLADWLDVGIRRLAPKGHLTLIQRMERLPEVLRALDGRLGSVVLRPIAGRAGKPPGRFLLRAIHSGRAPFVMAPPLIMHDGAAHDGDRESYSAQISQVLRGGAKLDIAL